MMRRGAATKSKGGKGGARAARRSRSVEGELSGEEGGLMLRRAAMDAEEAARAWAVGGSAPVDDAAAAVPGKKAGKGRPERKLHSKVLEAASTVQVEKAAAAAASAAAKVAAGGVAEGEKRAADVTQAAVAAADDTSGRVRMSQSLIDYILAREPEVFEDPDEYYARLTNHPKKLFSQEYIDESTATLRRLTESSKRIFAKFQKFQASVRAEYEEKGYVEVDDDYITERVMWRQAMEKNMPQAFRPMEGLGYADDNEE